MRIPVQKKKKKEFMPHIFSITRTSYFCSIFKDLKFCGTLSLSVK